MKYVTQLYPIIYFVYFIQSKNSKEEDTFVLSNKIIEIPYSSILNIFCTSLLFGSNNQYITNKINLSSQFTWFSQKVFNSSGSSSYRSMKKDIINIGFSQKEAEESIDRCTIVNKSSTRHLILNYPFYLTPETQYSMVDLGSFGLAFKFNDNNHSLIHHLYRHKFITRRSFGLYPHAPSNGSLFLGGIDQHLLEGMKSSQCHVNEFDSNWSCQLTHIYIGNISEINSTSTHLNRIYSFNEYSYFQSAENHIYCPLDFIPFLIDTAFKDSFNQKLCRYENSSHQYIECSCNITHTLPQINFVFDSISYTIPLQNLFLNGNQNDNCVLGIIHSGWYKNQWVFGTPFLKDFVSLFDYSNRTVTFYSINNFQPFDYFNLVVKGKIIKTLSTLTIILLSLSSVLILVSKSMLIGIKTEYTLI